MAKVMLVEDDNNLREIYAARLQAEGYEIVAAKDGEEALALAVKEKPELIISDVMMPRISGFDMLDILRNAPETKNTKVIMMTALSQAEDKARADKLGADRYLVKSQVTLEDVARTVKDVLEGKPEHAASAPQPTVIAAAGDPPSVAEPSTLPVPVGPSPSFVLPAPEPTPVPQPAPATEPPAMPAPSSAPSPSPVSPVASEPAISVAAPPVLSTPPVADDSTTTPPIDPVTPTDSTSPAAPVDVPATTPPAAPTNDIVPPPETTPVIETPEIPTPAEPPLGIKVELPTPPDELVASQASQEAPQPPPKDDASFVGPNLAEALASEEQAAGIESSNSEQAPLDAPAPAPFANGSPVQVAIEPDPTPAEPPVPDLPTPEPTAPEVVAPPPTAPASGPPAPSQTETAPVAAAGKEGNDDSVSEPHPAEQIAGKKVIKPISDMSKRPDINALYEKEKQMEAAENPAASTVIEPLSSSANEPQAPPADKHNDIAL